MKNKFINLYMKLAEETAQLSTARKLQVGAVIVKNNRIISLGYNGTPAGWDNNCEDEIRWPTGEIRFLETKPEVIHAEENALLKLARDGESGKDAMMFLTHNPCISCAKLIYGAGISTVYYKNDYLQKEKNVIGFDFLKKCGIEVIKYETV